MSRIWSAASALARFASARGWLKSRDLGVRVVSVGNLQVGGAGKTPLVAEVAREAASRGLRAWILCRGYGGRWESGGGTLWPDERAPDAADCGDEAALLRELAPGAVICVGADRGAQFDRAREAAAMRGLGAPELVILDDGFQHWKIKKDVEIVALTSKRPTDVPFRDSYAALERADLIVWTKGGDRPRALDAWPDVPRARVRYTLEFPASLERAIWLVTGVADGSDVERSARLSGYRIERHVSFRDHARYALPMVQKLVHEARRANVALAVTGKDWVKWRSIEGVVRAEGDVAPGSVIVLEPALEWLEGREQWNRVLWGS